MSRRAALLMILLFLFGAGCKPVCPPGSVTYLPDASAFPTLAISAEPGPSQTPFPVKIGGNMIDVDHMVEGPICNDVWSGTVYVGCNVQVVEWADAEYPLFLKDCDLTIEPETVVYVASHNDAAYYNGCTCHFEGETK